MPVIEHPHIRPLFWTILGGEFNRSGAGVKTSLRNGLWVMTSDLISRGPPLARMQSLVAACIAAALLAVSTGCKTAEAGPVEPTKPSDIADRLAKGYPGIITAVDRDTVTFVDGTRLALRDGQAAKSQVQWLAAPDIADMFRFPYPAEPFTADRGQPSPEPGFDPGRARNAAFFRTVYGDCRHGDVQRDLVDVAWLPSRTAQVVKITKRNRVADRLRAISQELDALPPRFSKYLVPAAGTFNCRNIAGTETPSAHGYGIAIDIAVAEADYWRWAARGVAGAAAEYRNRIPYEIVAVFEKHGFIWGGRWQHFDTMHFEYRPELLPPAVALPDEASDEGSDAGRQPPAIGP
jgi:hypothetical protein